MIRKTIIHICRHNTSLSRSRSESIPYDMEQLAISALITLLSSYSAYVMYYITYYESNISQNYISVIPIRRNVHVLYTD